MAMKEWLQWLPPPRSMLALLLAVAGFSGRLIASHFTHSPTLLVDACHSLCRLVGLITTLIAYKYERADENTGREGRLRNTFGWARIEVVGRLSVHVLFASFALALVVHALQLGVHAQHEHGQPPCLPRVIVACAVIGLLLYAINYLLLAGREMSYSRRLSMTEDGKVVLKTGAGEPVLAHAPTDIASSLFVMGAGLTLEWEPDVARIVDPAISACAAIILVIFNYPFSSLFVMGAGLTLEWEPDVARIVDPAISACAAIILVIFNYPFMRSAGLILLQTVPEGLGTCELRTAALKVPGVLAIHELHVWQLHRDRVVATAHVAYNSHQDYLKSSSLVNDVFKKHGIGLVTLQPEFFLIDKIGEERKALVEFANIACSSPCAKECIAPKCCEPSGKPPVTRI